MIYRSRNINIFLERFMVALCNPVNSSTLVVACDLCRGSYSHLVKGCGMGTLFVLVSPCFRENVVVTCKIRCFLCSLDNLLQKNIIVFFFENQISKWHSFEKRAILTNFSHFLFTRESCENSFSTYLTHTHTCILLTLLTFFCLTNFEKNTNLSGIVSLWYESWCWFLFAPFWNNQ